MAEPLAQPRSSASKLDVAEIYDAHAAFIGRVIQRLTGDGPHVDDLLQETFIVAFRRRGDFDGRAAVRSWLYGIASNLCRRHSRGQRRLWRFRSRLAREPRAPAPPSPEREVERSQAAALVHAALQQLPYRQREAFVLYELEGLQGREIAELLGIPIGTVWTRLHNARRAFAAQVRQSEAAESGACP